MLNMRGFISLIIPFLIKTSLMILVWLMVLLLALLVGVDNTWSVMISGGELSEIIDIEQHFLPEQFLLRTSQSLPMVDTLLKIVETSEFNVKTDLMMEVGTEVSKTALLGLILWVCKCCQKSISKISNAICDSLEKIGLCDNTKWARLITDLFCSVYTIVIGMGAADIVLLRFNHTMSFWGKAFPLIAIVAFGCMPFVLGGRYGMRKNAILFVRGPICSLLAAVCAIFMMASLTSIVYDPNGFYEKIFLALLFLVLCSILLYIATKDAVIDLKQKIKYS